MMGNFMEQIQQMQVQMEVAKKKLDQTFVEGVSPQEKVKVKMNGNRKIISISILNDFVSFDKEELEDYITLAVQNALDKAEAIHEKELKGVAGSMLPGMGS
jgi:DNA-binding YbaB/EbfC family protein